MPHAPSPSTPTRRRLTAVLSAVVVVVAGLSLAAPPAAAAAPSRPGTLSAGAYDYLTGLPADVVAGAAGTNLSISFTASRALDDGTMTVALPTRDWPTALQVGDRLGPNDPRLQGSVVVRPAEKYDDLTDADCRAAEGRTLTVTVTNLATARIASVSHLSCAAGQSVTLRVFDVQAPQRAGTSHLLGTVRDAAGGTADVLRVRVEPAPTTQLVLQPADPVSVQTYEQVPLTITAVTTRGRVARVDTRYRGTVNVVPVGTDCFFSSAEPLPVTFTAADRGSKTIHVSFNAPGPFQLEAYSITGPARTGHSATIHVEAGPDDPPTTCSRSYH